MRFVHETLGQRVRFAPGEAAGAVAEEVALLGAARVMVIASTRATEAARSIAVGVPVVWWHDEVVEHVPVAVAERARRAADTHDVDALLSVGGGSATGLAKAVALTSGLPGRGRAHDVRRERGHRCLGPHRGRGQDHRSGPSGAPADGGLRRDA